MRITSAIFIFLSMLAVSCTRVDNVTQADTTKQKFDTLYAQWIAECKRPEISLSSDTHTYTSLPSYRAIVALGRPALPYLQEKMEQDFMLAYAAAEIQGWKRSDFPARSEQEFRDKVLERMKKGT